MVNPAPVTVVIPVYKGAQFIAEAIESVLAQTMPVAEIIVVDDGSPDDSGAIAAGLGARVIKRANGGQAAARNTGIQAAEQKWIAFLDQDDFWEPEKIEKQWAALQLHPAARMVYCNFSHVEDGRIVLPSVLDAPGIGYKRSGAARSVNGISFVSFQKGQPGLVGAGQFMVPSAVIIERDLLLSVGMFDESTPPCEDIECFLRVLVHTPLIVVEQPLMRWRVHKNNDSRDLLRNYQGCIYVTELISHHPERYPDGADKAWSSALPVKYAEAGRLLLDAGKFREARDYFAKSLKGRPAFRPALLWLTTWFGPALFNSLLTLKRYSRRDLKS